MPEPTASLPTLADSLVGTFPACDDAPLARWPNVELDEQGRVVAFSGLSLTPTAHRFTVGGRQLYTWCAWDTLFLPALLGQTAQVESICPVTGRAVRLTVDPSGFRDVDPEELWVSFPAPATTPTADITGTFCCHVHFLADRPAADEWLTRHAATTALTLPDAFELGRLATRCCA